MSTDRDNNRGSRRAGTGKSSPRKKDGPGRGRVRSSQEPSGNRPFDKRPGRKRTDSEGDDNRERRSDGDRPRARKPFDKRERPSHYNSDSDRKDDRRGDEDRPRERKPFDKRERPSQYNSDSDRRDDSKERRGDSDRSRDKKPFDKRDDSRERRSDNDRSRDRKPFDKRERPSRFGSDSDRRDSSRERKGDDDKSRDDKPFEKRGYSSRFKSDETGKEGDGEKNIAMSRENYDKQHGRRKFERTEDTPAYKSKYDRDRGGRKPYKGKRGGEVLPSESAERDNRIRLNKYLSNSGLCNRREADVFIESGMVEVNGKTITEMGFKVNPGDVVKYAGEKLSTEKPVYVLMNKPKDFVTTMKDYKGSHTVKQLMRGVGSNSILPVGKLDRGTTGLLMFTNDGDLAKKLTHPKHNVKKLYHVSLDKSVKEEHLIQLVEGVELEDGTMAADVVSYVGDAKDKREVGVEIHGGKKRVLTRLFEGLGYKVMKLDRVVFAGLTKKDLPRGNWRFLTEQEINNLKMLK
jgi:23S rRNA pseudouridine2605 synthase